MKTIDEAIQDYINDMNNNGRRFHTMGEWVADAFRSGALFMQQWIPITDKLPEVNKIFNFIKNGEVATGNFIRCECDTDMDFFETLTNSGISHWQYAN